MFVMAELWHISGMKPTWNASWYLKKYFYAFEQAVGKFILNQIIDLGLLLNK